MCSHRLLPSDYGRSDEGMMLAHRLSPILNVSNIPELTWPPTDMP